MNNNYLFTSESVSEGHPDKVSDLISDTIVDLMISKYPYLSPNLWLEDFWYGLKYDYN